MSRTLPSPRPGLPLLRRARDRVQIGLDARTAVVVEQLSDVAAAALLHLDGTAVHSDLVRPVPELDALLTALHDRDLLHDDPGPNGALSAHRRERYADDLAALALRMPVRDAQRVLVRRARATVVVRGDDRAAAHIAVGLAAAGVGTVSLEGRDRAVALGDLTPVGPLEPDLGWREQVASAIRSQGARPSPTSVRSPRPSLVVISSAADVELPWTDPELADDLLADGVAHLAVAVAGDAARVGPLVLPGRTACLWCLDHRHRDSDAAWPALVDQVRLRHPQAHASSGVIASAAGALAVAQALQVIDDAGAAAPATLDAQYELRLPDVLPARLPVVRHPACGCGWSGLGRTMVG